MKQKVFDPLNPEGKKKVQEKVVEKKSAKKPVPAPIEEEDIDDLSFRPLLTIKANVKYCSSDEADRLVKMVVSGLKQFNDLDDFETKIAVTVNPNDN